MSKFGALQALPPSELRKCCVMSRGLSFSFPSRFHLPTAAYPASLLRLRDHPNFRNVGNEFCLRDLHVYSDGFQQPYITESVRQHGIEQRMRQDRLFDNLGEPPPDCPRQSESHRSVDSAAFSQGTNNPASGASVKAA
jgi:hypothetical protein